MTDLTDVADGGARLAVDVGTVRIGVAASAAGTTLAVPVETVPANADAVARVVDIATERNASVIYVGDPIRLNGEVGPAALAAREFARLLMRRSGEQAASGSFTVTVHLVDERLTSAQSGKQMRDAGRNTRKSRSVLDQAAAVAILQNALERERVTGRLAGVSAEQDD